MGRRGIKEYRAPEALILIAADRDRKPLVCPSCGAADIHRNPPRGSDEPGRVTLICGACNRNAVYLEAGTGPVRSPESPLPHPHTH